jgi:hypothetical protein
MSCTFLPNQLSLMGLCVKRKHNGITWKISCAVTSDRPSKAAKALAALFVTISPRNPSTSNSEQICDILTRKS